MEPSCLDQIKAECHHKSADIVTMRYSRAMVEGEGEAAGDLEDSDRLSQDHWSLSTGLLH